jgi:hypothetical protein
VRLYTMEDHSTKKTGWNPVICDNMNGTENHCDDTEGHSIAWIYWNTCGILKKKAIS